MAHADFFSNEQVYAVKNFKSEIAAALAEYDKLRNSTQACLDGSCVVKRPQGMHTNGGCRCAEDKYKARRMMYAGQKLRDQLTALVARCE